VVPFLMTSFMYSEILLIFGTLQSTTSRWAFLNNCKRF